MFQSVYTSFSQIKPQVRYENKHISNTVKNTGKK